VAARGALDALVDNDWERGAVGRQVGRDGDAGLIRQRQRPPAARRRRRRLPPVPASVVVRAAVIVEGAGARV